MELDKSHELKIKDILKVSIYEQDSNQNKGSN